MEATGAELQFEEVGGPLEIESRNTELVLDAAKLVKPPFRYNGSGGELPVATSGRSPASTAATSN